MTGMTGIRNIIFDMGNILIGFRWKDMLEEDRGLSPERAKDVGRAVFKSTLWEQFDMGLLSFRELKEGYRETEPALFEDIRWFLDNADRMGVDRPETWALVNRLKKEKGYRLYILSNYSEHLYELHAARAEKAIAFDGTLISYMVKMVKPDTAIYRECLSRFGLTAEESIFIDDTPDNVKGAESVGMRGVCVRTEEAVNELLTEWLK
ncbi:MAG: HAD family phosphatase [Lachnospiraceae bacterium]|nr:HAD family phosphatase [Lachnospiraceae bacterium]